MAMQWLVHTIGVITARTGGKRRGGRKGRPFFCSSNAIDQDSFKSSPPAWWMGFPPSSSSVGSLVCGAKAYRNEAFSRWRRKLSIPWGSKRPRATGGRVWRSRRDGSGESARLQSRARAAQHVTQERSRSFLRSPTNRRAQRPDQRTAQPASRQSDSNSLVHAHPPSGRLEGGTKAEKRRWHELFSKAGTHPTSERRVTRSSPWAFGDSPNTNSSPAALLESWRGI